MSRFPKEAKLKVENEKLDMFIFFCESLIT